MRLRRSTSAAVPLLAVEPVERAGQLGDQRPTVVTGECGPGASRGREQRHGNRSLRCEQPEQLHLLKRESGVRRPIEHLQHAEHALVVEERNGHHPVRHVPAPLCDVACEARVGLHVLEHERRPGRGTQPAIPVDDGMR